MADDEKKLNRRTFLEYSAAVSVTGGGLAAIALKTDAVAQQVQRVFGGRLGDGASPYPYQFTRDELGGLGG